MAEKQQTKEHDFRWVKQVYYYIVLLGCVLFLGIGSYMFLTTNLQHFVFTDLEREQISYMENGCQYQSDLDYYKNTVNKDIVAAEQIKTGDTTTQKTLTTQEREECMKLRDESMDKRIKIEYQRGILYSTLMLIIAGTILGIHVKYINPNKKTEKVAKK